MDLLFRILPKASQASAAKLFLGSGNAQVVAQSYDMAGHAQIRVERYCEYAKKKNEHFFSHPTLCRSPQCKKQEFGLVEIIIKSLFSHCPQVLVLGAHQQVSD